MAATVRVTTRGAQALQRRLAGLARRYGDLRPLMERFGAYLETSVLDRFEREEAPDGSRWKPSIRARETGGRTLTDRALLKGSISYQAESDSVAVGTNLIYAAAHQFGATIRGRGGPLRFKLPGGLGFRSVSEVTLPKREFLGFSAEDEDELAALAEDYANEAAA